MACSPLLTTRKRGEGVTFDIDKAAPLAIMSEPGYCSSSWIGSTIVVLLRLFSCLLLENGVWGKHRHPEHYSQIQINWILLRDPPRLTSLSTWVWGKSNWGCYRSSMSYYSKTGSRSSRMFDESVICRTVTTRQRRVIDFEDGIWHI